MDTNNSIAKTQIYNVIILDKSGSMYSIKNSAIAGYNETIGSIRAAQLKFAETQEHYISLMTFCGCGTKAIYDCVPIRDAENLTPEQYAPCCCTPLYDAIGATINRITDKTRSVDDAAVLITIITDGMENASKEWTGAAVKRLIDERKADGWMFSYIGADHDVEQAAAKISITNTVVWDKSEAGTADMFACESRARDVFFRKMSSSACACMSSDEKRSKRREFASEYYNESEF
jgi:uncharacterized protein YegL